MRPAQVTARALKFWRKWGGWNDGHVVEEGYVKEYNHWLRGKVDGGPNGDGLYPLTNSAGVTRMLPCVAKIVEAFAGMPSLNPPAFTLPPSIVDNGNGTFSVHAGTAVHASSLFYTLYHDGVAVPGQINRTTPPINLAKSSYYGILTVIEIAFGALGTTASSTSAPFANPAPVIGFTAAPYISDNGNGTFSGHAGTTTSVPATSLFSLYSDKVPVPGFQNLAAPPVNLSAAAYPGTLNLVQRITAGGPTVSAMSADYANGKFMVRRQMSAFTLGVNGNPALDAVTLHGWSEGGDSFAVITGQADNAKSDGIGYFYASAQTRYRISKFTSSKSQAAWWGVRRFTNNNGSAARINFRVSELGTSGGYYFVGVSNAGAVVISHSTNAPTVSYAGVVGITGGTVYLYATCTEDADHTIRINVYNSDAAGNIGSQIGTEFVDASHRDPVTHESTLAADSFAMGVSWNGSGTASNGVHIGDLKTYDLDYRVFRYTTEEPFFRAILGGTEVSFRVTRSEALPGLKLGIMGADGTLFQAPTLVDAALFTLTGSDLAVFPNNPAPGPAITATTIGEPIYFQLVLSDDSVGYAHTMTTPPLQKVAPVVPGANVGSLVRSSRCDWLRELAPRCELRDQNNLRIIRPWDAPQIVGGVANERRITDYAPVKADCLAGKITQYPAGHSRIRMKVPDWLPDARCGTWVLRYPDFLTPAIYPAGNTKISFIDDPAAAVASGGFKSVRMNFPPNDDKPELSPTRFAAVGIELSGAFPDGRFLSVGGPNQNVTLRREGDASPLMITDTYRAEIRQVAKVIRLMDALETNHPNHIAPSYATGWPAYKLYMLDGDDIYDGGMLGGVITYRQAFQIVLDADVDARYQADDQATYGHWRAVGTLWRGMAVAQGKQHTNIFGAHSNEVWNPAAAFAQHARCFAYAVIEGACQLARAVTTLPDDPMPWLTPKIDPFDPTFDTSTRSPERKPALTSGELYWKAYVGVAKTPSGFKTARALAAGDVIAGGFPVLDQFGAAASGPFSFIRARVAVPAGTLITPVSKQGWTKGTAPNTVTVYSSMYDGAPLDDGTVIGKTGEIIDDNFELFLNTQYTRIGNLNVHAYYTARVKEAFIEAGWPAAQLTSVLEYQVGQPWAVLAQAFDYLQSRGKWVDQYDVGGYFSGHSRKLDYSTDGGATWTNDVHATKTAKIVDYLVNTNASPPGQIYAYNSAALPASGGLSAEPVWMQADQRLACSANSADRDLWLSKAKQLLFNASFSGSGTTSNDVAAVDTTDDIADDISVDLKGTNEVNRLIEAGLRAVNGSGVRYFPAYVPGTLRFGIYEYGQSVVANGFPSPTTFLIPLWNALQLSVEMGAACLNHAQQQYKYVGSLQCVFTLHGNRLPANTAPTPGAKAQCQGWGLVQEAGNWSSPQFQAYITAAAPYL